MKKHNLKRVTEFLEAIDWMFELNNFNRNIIDEDNQPEDEPNLTAEMEIDETYKEFTINLYPHFWKLSLDLQRLALLHELVHSVLAGSKGVAEDLLKGFFRTKQEINIINEQATSRVTYFLDRLFRDKLRYAKKAYRDYLKKTKK